MDQGGPPATSTGRRRSRRRLEPNPCHPGAEGTRIRTYVRQSVLYSDSPRGSRRKQDPAPTEEHPNEASSSELGVSLSGISLSSLDEETDDGYDGLPENIEQRCFYLPQPKGVTTSMLLSLGDILTDLPDMEQPRPDSDDDPEELIREFQDYLDALPSGSLREQFDRLCAIEHATLTALAAERGIEPPEPLQLPSREPITIDRETCQLTEQASTAIARTRDSVAPRGSRHEVSMEETIEKGKEWMKEEMMLCFDKYIKRSARLAGLKDYHFYEFLHQCFNMESYDKVYHHYNFTVRMKMPDSLDWMVELYFAEVKEMFGTKYYFCCPLEPDENGYCHACKSQGVEDLKHPVTGGFAMGSLDAPVVSLWYTDEL